MNNQDYIKETERTDLDFVDYKNAGIRAHVNVEMVHYTDGLSTEAGELKDVYKKHIAYNKPIDLPNVKEELGDLLWYIARICDLQGWTIEEVQQLNIDKLKARYPEKFTSKKAIDRNLIKERQILEGE